MTFKFWHLAVVWLAGAMLSLGLIGFGVWVVIKLLQHFGVI